MGTRANDPVFVVTASDRNMLASHASELHMSSADLHQILPMLCAPHITHHIRHTIRTGHHRAVKDMAFSAQNDILITVRYGFADDTDYAFRLSIG